MNAIETQGLTKWYGKHRGIVEVNLTVAEGDFFGFIGPNGAGKSTTIRLLMGLLRRSSGRAALFGRDVDGRREELLADVGYLPSETTFYAGMRVGEVLRLSAALHRTDCRPEAERLCRRLDLDVTRRVEELSLGNRKKVAIVCALQHNPRLCILDEPTSGLDPLMQREFFAILKERHERGATVFLSSHILSDIQRSCTRAGIIRDGRLIACDRVEALAQSRAKRVTVQGEVELAGLPGVRDVRQTEGGVSFLYGGAMPALLQRLAGREIRDLTVTEPDLEEVFMHYYQEEGATP